MTITYRTTKIQWTATTWNPARGCTAISAGCLNCYAKRLAKRFGDAEFTPTMIMERVTQPMKWRKPRMIFVCSMSDLFHDSIPDEFITEVYATMLKCPQHTFQVLTKRPERMRRFVNTFSGMLDGYPKNIWHGVTAENQVEADRRIPILLTTQCGIKFISAEPLLELIDIWQYLGGNRNPIGSKFMGRGLDWVIVGGETGSQARECREEWIKRIFEQCLNANVPFFFKAPGRKWKPTCVGQDAGQDCMNCLGLDCTHGIKRWEQHRKWPRTQ